MMNLKITMVQMDIAWHDPGKNLSALSDKLSDVNHVDLIILPEMFTTGFTMDPESCYQTMEGPAVSWMKSLASEKKCCVMGSMVIRSEDSFCNRLICAHQDGGIQFYDKRHLFRMANEHDHYKVGKQKTIIEIKGWKIMPLVCYDLRFPVWSRNRKTEKGLEYDLVIYVANWPERRRYPWTQLLKARAIENLSYCIGVNRVGVDNNQISYSGDTACYDYKGEVLAECTPSTVEIKTLELVYQDLIDFRKNFPAWMDADDFEIKL